MAIFKCTWFFESLQQQDGTTASSDVGWTETWYQEANDVETALIEMRKTDANASYLGTRLAFMPSTYRIAWMRASDVARPQYTKLVGPPTVSTGKIDSIAGGAAAKAPAQVNCCMYVDFFAPPRNDTDRAHHRRFLIRGLPVGMINGNIVQENAASFTALLRFCDYVGQVRAPRNVPINNLRTWKMRVQDNAQPYKQIDTLVINPDNDGSIIVTSATIAAASGQKFNLKGIKFPYFTNRVWTSQVAVAAGGGIVMRPGRRHLAGAWDHTGQIQPVVTQLVLPTQYTVIGLRNKKIGPPSKPTRGRRRA